MFHCVLLCLNRVLAEFPLSAEEAGPGVERVNPGVGLLKCHNFDKCILEFGQILFYLGQIQFANGSNEFPLPCGPGEPKQGARGRESKPKDRIT